MKKSALISLPTSLLPCLHSSLFLSLRSVFSVLFRGHAIAQSGQTETRKEKKLLHGRRSTLPIASIYPFPCFPLPSTPPPRFVVYPLYCTHSPSPSFWMLNCADFPSFSRWGKGGVFFLPSLQARLLFFSSLCLCIYACTFG